jgi:hypothetical protein
MNAQNKIAKLLSYHRSMRMQYSPPITLVLHGSGDLAEASNVGTGDQAWELAFSWSDVLLGCLKAVIEAVLHDALELVVDLLAGPLDAGGVLSHLETGNGDTTGVGCLA